MLLFIFFFFLTERIDTLEAGHTNQMKYEKKENLHIKNQGPNWKDQWARFDPWADSWWPLANGSIQDERIFFLTQMIVVKKIKSSLKCFMKSCHNLLHWKSLDNVGYLNYWVFSRCFCVFFLHHNGTWMLWYRVEAIYLQSSLNHRFRHSVQCVEGDRDTEPCMKLLH